MKICCQVYNILAARYTRCTLYMEIYCQVYRADSYEPDGRPGQVGLKFPHDYQFSFAAFFLFCFLLFITFLELLARFEWPNGDEYTGQYINGKRNGLGDMKVLNW